MGHRLNERKRTRRDHCERFSTQLGDAQANLDVNEIFRGQPRPAGAAPAIDVGQSHVLLFSGATGRYITLDIDQRPLFPREVLAYHTITDTWTLAGNMPAGVVTTGVVKWANSSVWDEKG